MLGGINKTFSIKRGVVLVTIFSFFLISNQNIFGQQLHTTPICASSSLAVLDWDTSPSGGNQVNWLPGYLTQTFSNVSGTGTSAIITFSGESNRLGAWAGGATPTVGFSTGVEALEYYTFSGFEDGNYNQSGGITIKITFSRAVTAVGFDINHINSSIPYGDFYDISATINGGGTIEPSFTPATSPTYSINTPNAGQVDGVGGDGLGSNSRLGVNFLNNTGITEITIIWRNCRSCSNFREHGGSIGNIEFCTVPLTDQCDASDSGNLDTDGDNVSDICDLDDDNDGILDTVECPELNATSSSLLPNGDFNNNYVDANNQGTPYTVSEKGFVPPPWNRIGTVDLQTDVELNFDDLNSSGNDVYNRVALGDFDSSPAGGSFVGFRSVYFTTFPTGNEGIYNTISITDADEELCIFLYYTEYLDPNPPSVVPQQPRPNPLVNIQFRINSTSAETGILIQNVDNLATTGGTEGTWEQRVITFTPSDFGITDNSTFNFYLGSSSSAQWNWAFVDGLVIQSKTGLCDVDNDGIPNHLDLDSDGDGCPDAVEAAGTFMMSDLVDSSLDGGNTGPDYTGTAGAVIQNLGNTVNDNGIPIPPGTAGNGVTGQDTAPAVTDLAINACTTITANNDDFSTNPIDTNTGGTAGNVLTNDDYNGSTPVDADVDITVTNNGGLTDVTIDDDGNIIVPSGTPTNTYTVTYQICEAGATTLCDTAQVIIVVNNPCTDNAGSGGVPTATDSDGDGINNVCDLDDDNDGILDKDEQNCAYFESNFGAGTLLTGTGSNADMKAGDVYLIPQALEGNNGTYYDAVLEVINIYGADTSASLIAAGAIEVSSITSTEGWIHYKIHFVIEGTATTSNLIGQQVTFDNITYTFGDIDSNDNQDLSDIIGYNPQDVSSVTVGNNLINYSSASYPSGLNVYAVDPALAGDPTNWTDEINATGGDDYEVVVEYTNLTSTEFMFGATGTVVTGFQRGSGIKFEGNACADIDTDGDGIPNHLDLDSDGDGCPDAVEAAGTFMMSDLVDSSMNGGNTGSDYTGTAGAVTQNLGNTVNDNGIPIPPGTAGNGVTGQDTTSAVTDGAINLCEADLSLTKTVDNALPKVGEDIVYTITIKNDGPIVATGVQVTDVLPTNLTYVSHVVLDSGAPFSGTTYTDSDAIAGRDLWTIGNIAVNQTINLQITARVNNVGTTVNTAQVSKRDQPDADSAPGNNK